MKSLAILGSSGSIGESTLQVVAESPERLRVTGLAVHHSIGKLLEQARRFDVRLLAVADVAAAREARRQLPAGTQLLEGEAGVAELAATADADVVVGAMVGMAGLKPVLAALRAGRHVALATKEALVAAGEIVMRERAQRGVRLLPVDSEHSAIFQCLQSPAFAPACVRDREAPPGQYAETRVRRLLLTASGGPFAARPEIDLKRVTVAEALRHPRWSMGRKISVDSATMMNKGLEIMEAHWLFNLPLTAIGVIVHPESIVHSLVEFNDRAMLAQLSLPDMRHAIHYALSWPDREPVALPALDLARLARLHFAEPDEGRFPCLRLARAAAAAGGTAPAALNAANEVAVAAFLAGRLTFAGIWETVEKVLDAHQPVAKPSLEEIFEADAWARRQADIMTVE
ncbi:MAG: 1-deoxy-D-xylulose-5-phosphate reductoisomerase [Kiritimatiellae bacterium]|nr:1-deoxy-D-xylulose-5-phosphate reductoisomerase [Kiritimatiellia bacterium]